MKKFWLASIIAIGGLCVSMVSFADDPSCPGSINVSITPPSTTTKGQSVITIPGVVKIAPSVFLMSGNWRRTYSVPQDYNYQEVSSLSSSKPMFLVSATSHMKMDDNGIYLIGDGTVCKYENMDPLITATFKNNVDYGVPINIDGGNSDSWQPTYQNPGHCADPNSEADTCETIESCVTLSSGCPLQNYNADD